MSAKSITAFVVGLLVGVPGFVFLVSYLIVTEEEQIRYNLEDVLQAVEKQDQKLFLKHLSDTIAVKGEIPRTRQFRSAGEVNVQKRKLGQIFTRVLNDIDISENSIRSAPVKMKGQNAKQSVKLTTYIRDSGPAGRPAIVESEWELTWKKEKTKWLLTRIEGRDFGRPGR